MATLAVDLFVDNLAVGNSIERPPSAAYSETSTAVASDIPDDLDEVNDVRAL